MTAAIAACATFLLFRSGASESLTAFFLSTWFRQRGAIQAPSAVSIVRVDEDSFRALGATSMFFPRRAWAELLKKLGEAGATSAVMDISFRADWPTDGDDALLERGLESLPTILGVRGAVILGREKVSPNEPLVKPEFATKSAGLAHMLLASPDTRVVRFPQPIITKERIWDPLFVAAARAVGASAFPSAHDYLRFYGAPGTINGMSLKDVLRLSPRELEPIFKGRVVFVGYTRDDAGEVGARDKFLTPYPGEMVGVEIHATAAANAIEGKWLTRRGSGHYQIVLLVCLDAFLVMALSARYSTMVALAMIPGWWLAGYAAFRGGIVIPGPELPAVIFPVWILRLAWDQSKQADLLMQLQIAFRCLLPKEFAKRLIADPGVLEGSRKKEVTLLFSDIEGFTSYSENASDAELNTFIDLYDTALDEAVTEEGGFVIDFAGDGMLALFGAPLDTPNPNAAAFKAVQNIQEKLSALVLREDFPRGAPLKTRFGINAGSARVGIIGAKSRKYYRALGDPVNVGQRIVELNIRLGTTLLFPESIARDLSSPGLGVVPMGTFKLKGRETPVALCTIRPPGLSLSDVEYWNTGLNAFKDGRWEGARRAFDHVVLSECAFKKAAQFYLNQLKQREDKATRAGCVDMVDVGSTGYEI